jgi:hypothetical protein
LLVVFHEMKSHVTPGSAIACVMMDCCVSVLYTNLRNEKDNETVENSSIQRCLNTFHESAFLVILLFPC